MKTSMKILIAIGVVALIVGVVYMVFRVDEPATNVDTETEKELSTNVGPDTEEEPSTDADSETEKEPSTDGNSETSLAPIASNEDLTALVDKIYEGLEIEMPMVMSQTIDVTDSETVKYITGLDNADDVEYVVASEPMMTSQAYSLVLVKAKDGADIEKMAKTMNENIDNRKWICVTAEKVYTTTSGNIICLVMSNEETAKAVYDNFKTLAGTVGEEYERTEEEIALPDDMLPAYDGEAL